MSTLERFLARFTACKFLRILVARNHLFVLTLGNRLFNLYWTFLWTGKMAHKTTPVSQFTQNPLTLLSTLVFLVLSVVRVAHSRADMATV